MSNKTSPTPCITASYFLGTGFLVIISIKINNARLPSREGIGNKLKIPRFIVIRAIIGSKFAIPPLETAEDIAAVTPTGPET